MFNRIYPKRNLVWGKEGFGAIELGLRYSSFDASDFTTAAQGCVSGTGCLTTPTKATALIKGAAFTNQADAWTAGAKWILTPNARLMLDYVHTSFDTPVVINSKTSDYEDAVAMRAQYDF